MVQNIIILAHMDAKTVLVKMRLYVKKDRYRYVLVQTGAKADKHV